jgi:hypothetical protein
VDRDGVFGAADFALLEECLAGPSSWPDPWPPLTPQDCGDAFDGDGDLDVDVHDVAVFQAAM